MPCQVDEGEDVCLGLGQRCCSKSWEKRHDPKPCSTLINKRTNHKEEMGYCCEGLNCVDVDKNTGVGKCGDET